jgi:hypothetical protein
MHYPRSDPDAARVQGSISPLAPWPPTSPRNADAAPRASDPRRDQSAVGPTPPQAHSDSNQFSDIGHDFKGSFDVFLGKRTERSSPTRARRCLGSATRLPPQESVTQVTVSRHA